MSGIDKYIVHGRAALRTHPDFDSFEPEAIDSLAADCIASILHAVDEAKGLSPRQAEAEQDNAPWELLERSWRSYSGDFEDLEDDDASS